jgi:hypothetical protein
MIFLAFFNTFSGIFYANLPEVFFVETNTFIYVMLAGGCMTFLDKLASRTLFFLGGRYILLRCHFSICRIC